MTILKSLKTHFIQLKSILVFVLYLLIVKTGFAQSPPSTIANGLDAIFQNHVTQFQGFAPGHVIRIEKPGAWIYENSAGLSSLNPAINMQADKKFKIASINKLFTTVAIFKLIQNGQVNFNAPISTYLPLSKV